MLKRYIFGIMIAGYGLSIMVEHLGFSASLGIFLWVTGLVIAVYKNDAT